MINGRSIDFWNDPWIPSLPASKISSSKPLDSNINMLADVNDVQTGQWNTGKLAREVSQEEMEAILAISLPLMIDNDG